MLPVAEDGVWLLGGDVHIDEFERELGHDLPRGDYETIAGLVIAERGDLPEPGLMLTVELPPDPADLVMYDEPRVRLLEIEVLAVERYVPAKVRVRLLDDEPSPEFTGDQGRGVQR